MAPQWRFWEHFLPVVGALKVDGHEVAAAVHGDDPDGPAVEGMVQGLTVAGAEVMVRDRKQSAGRFVGDLTAEQWDAVVLCAEHLSPMNLVKPALRARGKNTPVLSMQHGLCQAAEAETKDWCDAFMLWGTLGGQFVASQGHATFPMCVTGTPRFDSYREEDAEDGGFLLACAGHVNGQGGRCTEEWLEGVLKATPLDMRVIVKVHPNDRDGRGWTKWTEATQGRVTVARYKDHPREYLRQCSALYLDYPSTYWLEAKCFGKPVICDGQAEVLANRPIHDVLLAQGAAAVKNIVRAIQNEIARVQNSE